MINAVSSFLTKSVFTPGYVHFTARITELRKQAGMTQAELALRLGRPQSYVSKYERGERRLDVVEFLAVAHALDANAAELVAELEKLEGRQAPQHCDTARSQTLINASPKKRD